MPQEVAGEKLVAPALDLSQGVLNLRYGGTYTGRSGAQLAGEGVGVMGRRWATRSSEASSTPSASWNATSGAKPVSCER